MESLLIISGSMGAGKTAVMSEASDILASRQIAHAAIDLDALGLVHLFSEGGDRGVIYRNLECVCKNYGALGVTRLLLAGAMESRAELELCRGVVSATRSVVCRLTASIQTMEERVRTRELGVWQQRYVDRVAELNAILDRARLEDFSIANENRPLTDVAHELLVKAEWILK
jgi:hypothetical protein